MRDIKMGMAGDGEICWLHPSPLSSLSFCAFSGEVEQF
jgi:hypothetical protein